MADLGIKLAMKYEKDILETRKWERFQEGNMF